MSVLTGLLVLLAAVYGAASGLLVPRAAYRLAVVPEQPWRDACPGGHPLTGGPARGWLGPARCAACPPGTPRVARPWRYAVLGAAACGALAAAVGPRPELAAYVLPVPVVLLLAAVDRAVQRLPDVLTLPLAAALAALLGVASLLPAAGGHWTGALLGALVLSGCYLLLSVLHPRGMGMGDVKLAPAVGLALGWYGWTVLFLGTFTGFALGAVYGLTLLARRRTGRRDGMPFGPFMAAGALTGVLLGALAA